METYKVPVSTRGVGISSLLFGIIGAAFFWWTPLGMVLSLTGLVLGFVGWMMARRMSAGSRLSLTGLVISLVAFALNCVIAGLGLELIRLH
jgi:hypothetical protein